MRKSAIITGIYGQDGSLLAERLLAQGWRVVGIVNKTKPEFRGIEDAEIIEADISDLAAMRSVFKKIQPDECYHLAAAHHSSEQITAADFRMQMLRVNFLATQALIDTIVDYLPHCRFLYAGSSQMYTPGEGVTVVNEISPYRPSSYYGITKVAGANLVSLMRRERKLWGLTAVLFNHESPRRRPEFLSRKVTMAAAQSRVNQDRNGLGLQTKLELRDISARVDWSAAVDIVKAMQMSLQVEQPQDYVLASGQIHSVRELLDEAFNAVNVNWAGCVVAQESGLGRCLQGDSQRAHDVLGWRPQYSFPTLIQEMVAHDLHTLSGT